MDVDPARIDLRVGGDYFVDFNRTDGGALDGVIVRIESERTLAYVWGVSVVEWILEPDGDQCRSQFVHHGMPPRDVEDEEGVAAGWHAWLEDLEAHLEGIAPSPGPGPGPGPGKGTPRWKELMPPYKERLDDVLGR